MLSLFIGIQYVGIVLLMVEVIYILCQRPSKLQIALLLVTMATLVNFVGYLFEIEATTKEMALQAVKFIYLAKPYIILGAFLFIMRYFRVKLPLALRIVLCVWHAGISMLVLTCEYNNLFYNSIEFVDDGFFPHLVLGHGIFYNLYTICIAAYLVVIHQVGVKRFRQSNDSKERIQIVYLMTIAIVAAVGFVLFSSGVTKGYDSTLPAYLICTFILLISLVRYKILDTVALAKDNVIDEFSDGLIVLDHNDNMIFANRQVKMIYPEFEGEDYATTLNMLEELNSKGEKLFLDQSIYEIHKKDILKGDAYYGKILVVSDITEGYNYTIELERQTAIADQANKAKSVFLAKMSHEIRTPINAIIGMNEMILRESRESDIKQYATDIQVSADSLLDIVNDILDSSKIESGKLTIMPVTYGLQDLLSNVVNLFSLKAKSKMLKFEIVVDEQLPCKQFGDDARLRQILVNLLNNAVKYTQEGGITLRVSGKRMESAVLMHYEIEDTGIGIKEEDLPKLCDAFVRLEESKNRNIEGTGLGMTIVVELLRMMNSQLQVESVYGKGSTFSFDVIQGVVSGAPMGRFRMNTTQNVQEYKALFTAPRAKILVVDDNQVNRKVFGNLLKKTLVQITELDSGEKCLERIQQERFDLIFLDYMMPNMDGVETLHRMKELTNNLCEGVPVIVLTADAVSDARERYLGKGFDDFLSKPVAGIDLERMIQKYLPAELMKEA